MGTRFSSPVTRNFLCLILVDLMVISACIFPVVPVNSSEVLFELKDCDVKTGEFVYRWFDIGKGQEVQIDYWCDGDVEAYLLTRSQFTGYTPDTETESLKTLHMTPTGRISMEFDEPGVYFFMIKNPGEEDINIIFSQCTGSTIERVTIMQKVKEYCYRSGVIHDPSMSMIREKPGVGSFA